MADRSIAPDRRHNGAIAEEDALLAAAVRSAFKAIITCTPQGIVTSWNAGAERVGGVPARQIIGQSLTEVISADRRQDLLNAIETAGGGRPLPAHHSAFVGPGGTAAVHMSISPIRDGEGVIVGVSIIVRNISGRDRAVIALRESEERYRSVVSAMVEGVVVQDTQGAILACNPRAEQILGLTAAEMQGRRSVDPRWRSIREDGTAFPGEAHPSMLALRTGLAQNNVCMGVEKPDGSLTWILINSQPIFHHGHPPADAVVTTFADITEKRHAEEAIRASEERFRVALQNSPIVVFNQDRDLRYTWINRAVGAWAEKGWYGKTDAEILDRPEDAAALTAVKQRILDTGQGIRAEIPIHHAGRPVYFDFTGEPLRDAAGNIVGVTCAVLDMTERKLSEEQLRRASLYARNLIEASLDPLVTISRDGKITDVNRATELATGLDRDKLIGSDFSDYFTEPERARDGYRKVFELESVRDYPLAIRHVSGRLTHVLYNASLFRNEDGQVEGAFAAARDITERRVLEDQLLQAQKLEAIGRLAGGVAHDFNNIMSIIMGYSELIKGGLAADDPGSRHLENIVKASERAAALTRQLLAFSRKQVMDVRVFHLNDQVVELSRMLPRLIGENIQLALELAPDLDPVRADPMRIQQVLINLAVNARDAMPRGGTLTFATANAELDADYQRVHPEVVPGPYVMISVSDTGIGMDPQMQSHIFEPFFTTKDPSRGTGLGLSIIYGIVRQSGGHIWVYSEVGRGSTFRIYLPRATEVAMPVAARVHAEPADDPADETILVVEDEKALAELTCTILRQSGYTVLVANSGEEAARLARSHAGPIHALLTDVILSTGINGIELAQHLRALRPKIKLLFMSGYSDVLLDAESRLGVDAILLEKPFPSHQLLNAVRKVLGTSAEISDPDAD